MIPAPPRPSPLTTPATPLPCTVPGCGKLCGHVAGTVLTFETRHGHLRTISLHDWAAAEGWKLVPIESGREGV